jgi:acyl-CoA reductase-like NAD-dependent aldehyde dehydrogenase
MVFSSFFSFFLGFLPEHLIRCRSWNHGQACCAGTRVFVQEGIYDKFLSKFTERVKKITLGDPFQESIAQGPQVSQIQFDVSL